MTGGFDAVPAELRGTASRIDEVIGSGSMVWAGPGFDFGHSAVELAWGVFDQEIQQQYDTLIAAAAEHGAGLRQAAGAYEEADLGTGAGAQIGGQFGLGDDGKFHVGGSLGIGIGVGGKVSFDMSVDPGEVIDTVGDVAKDVGKVADSVADGAREVGKNAEKVFKGIGRKFGF